MAKPNFGDVSNSGGSSAEITEEEKAQAVNTQSDLDELLGLYGGPTEKPSDELDPGFAATDEDAADNEDLEQAEASAAKGSEEPEEEKPADEPEEVLEESGEEQETLDQEEEPEETPAEEDEGSAEPSEDDDRFARLEAQNAKLMKALNEQQILAEEPTPPPAPEPEPTSVPVPVAEVPKPQELTDESFYEITSKKEAFQNYIAAEINAGVQVGVQQALSQVSGIVTNVNDVRDKIQGFFNRPENTDVVPLMDYVVKNAKTIEVAEPGLSVHEVLDRSAKQVRETLGLETAKGVTVESDGTVRVPQQRKGAQQKPSAAQKFAKPTHRRKPQKPFRRRDSVADQIDEMNRHLA